MVSAFTILTSTCASATTACTFPTSQLPKVLGEWCFAHFDSEMCFIQFFNSQTATWLCTRRFSELTYYFSTLRSHKTSPMYFLLLIVITRVWQSPNSLSNLNPKNGPFLEKNCLPSLCFRRVCVSWMEGNTNIHRSILTGVCIYIA